MRSSRQFRFLNGPNKLVFVRMYGSTFTGLVRPPYFYCSIVAFFAFLCFFLSFLCFFMLYCTHKNTQKQKLTNKNKLTLNNKGNNFLLLQTF